LLNLVFNFNFFSWTSLIGLRGVDVLKLGIQLSCFTSFG
jgi:hypothetical protein